MRRSLIAALALLPLAATMAPAAATDAGTGDRTVTRIVTVSGDTAADRAAVLDEAERAGIDLTVTRRFDKVLSGFTVRVFESDAARLAALPDVAEVAAPVTYEAPPSPTPVSAETVRRAVADATSGDRPGTRESSPSGREIVTVTGLTGVAEAHRAGHTGKGVTVGIIDSGIAYDHPALGGGGFPNAKVTGGWDFADEDADPYDSSTGPATGHGTHVAGIVAGDGPQTVGVAPDATLRAYRVFGEKNQPTDEIVIAALEKAVEDGVDIVNLSLGNPNGARSSNALARAVDRVSDSGVTATVAIGNGYAGPFRAASPAVADEAIAVGSTHSERYGYLAFRFADGTDTPIPYLNITRAPSTPADGSLPVVKGTATCDALPEGSLTGKAVLFTGTLGLPCKPMDAIRRFEAAGAAATVYYTTSGDQLPRCHLLLRAVRHPRCRHQRDRRQEDSGRPVRHRTDLGRLRGYLLRPGPGRADGRLVVLGTGQRAGVQARSCRARRLDPLHPPAPSRLVRSRVRHLDGRPARGRHRRADARRTPRPQARRGARHPSEHRRPGGLHRRSHPRRTAGRPAGSRPGERARRTRRGRPHRRHRHPVRTAAR